MRYFRARERPLGAQTLSERPPEEGQPELVRQAAREGPRAPVSRIIRDTRLQAAPKVSSKIVTASRFIAAPTASLWCGATASRMHHAFIHPSLFRRRAVPDSRADSG